MKKMVSILAVFLLLAFLPAGGQNVKIVSQTCPDCGVTVYGRLLEASDHQPGCQWYAGPETESSHNHESVSSGGNSAYSDSNSFGLIEGRPLTNDEYYELLLRTHCDYCGGEGINHKADCIIGKTYRLWQDAMHAGRERDAIRLRDNVVTLMLGSRSGMDKIHVMRGTAAPKPDPAPVADKPSTKLKDYSPAPEKPAASVSAPLIPCPLAQPAPQFSGINEQSIIHEKMQSSMGVHEWGVMQDINEKYPFEYDIERHTHTDGGPVILGKRNPDGSIVWHVLHRDHEGKYKNHTLLDSYPTRYGDLRLLDVHFEGEGQYVVEEYEGGYKMYYTADYEKITSGYNVGLAPVRLNGRFLLLKYPDPPKGANRTIHDHNKSLYDGTKIALIDDDLIIYEDAVIERDNEYGDKLINWDWTKLSLEGTTLFKKVECFNSDRGSYYVIEVSDGKYALIARGFRRIGGIYASADEAHAAWKKQ